MKNFSTHIFCNIENNHKVIKKKHKPHNVDMSKITFIFNLPFMNKHLKISIVSVKVKIKF